MPPKFHIRNADLIRSKGGTDQSQATMASSSSEILGAFLASSRGSFGLRLSTKLSPPVSSVVGSSTCSVLDAFLDFFFSFTGRSPIFFGRPLPLLGCSGSSSGTFSRLAGASMGVWTGVSTGTSVVASTVGASSVCWSGVLVFFDSLLALVDLARVFFAGVFTSSFSPEPALESASGLEACLEAKPEALSESAAALFSFLFFDKNWRGIDLQGFSSSSSLLSLEAASVPSICWKVLFFEGCALAISDGVFFSSVLY
mmetsp:Transcript_6824/g.11015  ORF Transcript_6824/g.11015 Transcript_6824/m.11015 type:complete len:256 (+) Transcript_6824:1-768(+)